MLFSFIYLFILFYFLTLSVAAVALVGISNFGIWDKVESTSLSMCMHVLSIGVYTHAQPPLQWLYQILL